MYRSLLVVVRFPVDLVVQKLRFTAGATAGSFKIVYCFPAEEGILRYTAFCLRIAVAAHRCDWQITTPSVVSGAWGGACWSRIGNL